MQKVLKMGRMGRSLPCVGKMDMVGRIEMADQARVKAYKVYDRDGRCRMSTTIGCRYEKDIEMDLLEAGYVIKIDGKKLTKKEVRERE